jgi:hypothetical protein
VIKVGESTLTARFPPRIAVASGDVVDVALTPAHLHVFDARSEQNVLAGAPIDLTPRVVVPAGVEPT